MHKNEVWGRSDEYNGRQERFCDHSYHYFCSHSAKKWSWCGRQSWVWVVEAKSWCWSDLWTPWPRSPGSLQKAKAYLHALGQQRSHSTVSAWCHTKWRVLQWSRPELMPKRKLLWSWYRCMPCCTASQRCCQGHSGCTGGNGLLCWRVQRESKVKLLLRLSRNLFLKLNDKMRIRKCEKKDQFK